MNVRSLDLFLARSERPRVLYVFEQPEYSGAEVMQLPLLLADSDPLATCPPGSRTEAWLEGRGVPTVALRHRTLRHSGGALETLRSLGRGLLSARDLRRILRAHPERAIVCCTSVRPGLLTAIAQIGLGRRALWVVTDFLPAGVLGKAIRLVARARCEVAVPSSKALAADFVGDSKRLARATAVVYPGVDVERFAADADRSRRRCAIVVGHISPTKHTALAIEVARRIAACTSDFRLTVVGRAQYRQEDFAYERELRESVESDPRLRTAVEFRGHRADVAGELRRCGLLLHCRADEPFGIVMVEAMAAGLPVVAPRAGGALEIVDEGRTGLLYEPEDAEDAARAVSRLLADPALAARMGAAARERARLAFSADEQLRRFDALLASLAAPRAATSASAIARDAAATDRASGP